MSSLVLTGALASGAVAAEAPPVGESAAVEVVAEAPASAVASAAGAEPAAVEAGEPQDAADAPGTGARPTPEAAPNAPDAQSPAVAPASPVRPPNVPASAAAALAEADRPEKQARARSTTGGRAASPAPATESVAGVGAEAPATLAGAPGVCDTNANTGKVDSFLQRSDVTEFANGNLSRGLVEGGYTHQRVRIGSLHPGENELTFTYRVKYNGVFAYDYLDNFSMTGAEIVRVQTIEGSGENRVDTVKLTFDVADTASEEESAQLFFSAHIASSLDHGPGQGAGSINGSAYHVVLDSLNCKATGSMDNQISANQVQYGTLTIVKDADPADGTDFGFHLAVPATDDTVEFKLDDSVAGDSGATNLPAGATYTVAPGSATVSEESLPAGWSLTALVCTGATVATNLESGTATIPVADGARVTCNFTNTKRTYRDLTVSTTARPSYVRDYDWSMEKTAPVDRIESATGNVGFGYRVVVDAGPAKDGGFKLTGKIVVGNPNSVAIGGVTVTGTLSGADCTLGYADGDPVTGAVTVPAGGATYTYECSLPRGTTAASEGTFPVTATWNAPSYYGTGGQAGATASYDFAAATPTVTDGSVTVTDREIDLAALPGGNVVAASDAPRTFEYTLAWPGVAGTCTKYTNDASYKEADGGTGTASEDVTLCLGADLSVTKNVLSSFDRTYLWDVEKVRTGSGPYTADPETGEVAVEYEVTVQPRTTDDGTGYRDSGWAMIGTITVENPNDWQAVGATVADAADIGGGAVCSVTSGTLPDGTTIADRGPEAGFQTTIPAGQAAELAYVCTFESQPDYTGTNTATVTWDAAGASTTSGTDAYRAPVTLGTWGQTPVNNTVVVTDDFHTFDPAWTVTWSRGMEPQSRTYTRTWTVDEPGTCREFTNTATISAAGEDTGPALDSDADRLKACRQAPPKISKEVEATFDRTYLWDIDKELAEGQEDTVETGTASTSAVDYDVVVTSDGYTDSNFVLGGTITVSNPNTYDGGDIRGTVTDTIDIDGLACSVDGGGRFDVAPGAMATLDYTCTTDGATASTTGRNTATATWDGGARSATSDVEKVAFKIRHSIDDEVDVVDDFAGTQEPGVIGSVKWKDVTYPRGDWSRTFERSIAFDGKPGECAAYRNTASLELENLAEGPTDTADVVVCDTLGLTATKTASARYDRDYGWQLLKVAEQARAVVDEGETANFDYTVSAVPDGYTDSNHRVTGTITLTNPNTFAGGAITATVADSIDIAGVVCTVDGTYTGAGNALRVVVPANFGEHSGVLTLGYECTGTPEDGDYTGTNTANVRWDGGTSTAAAPVSYEADQVKDRTVAVFDDMVSNLDAPVRLGEAEWTENGEGTEFTYSLPLPGVPGTCVDHTNTALLDAEGEGTEDHDAHETVTVCVKGGLAAEQSAAAELDRTHLWDIDKSADATTLEVTDSGEATFGYTVTATPAGSADSGHTLSGEITLTNPNDFDGGAITATVAESVDVGGGAVCSVTGPGGAADADPGADGFQVEVPARTGGGTGVVVLRYDCDFTGAPAAKGTGTATVAWDGGSATAAVPVEFGTGDTANGTVKVYDDKANGSAQPALLGEAEWNATGVPTEFDYRLTHEGVPGTCVDSTNTAWVAVDGPDGSEREDPRARETVTLCVEDDLVVAKTAKASFDRTYLWDIGKSASETKVETGPEGTHIFDYTVEAIPDGYRDSDWQLEGKITLTNPNDYSEGAITAAVRDLADVGAGVVCDVDGGDAVTVAPGGTKVLRYECDFEGKPDYRGTNTALVEWDGGRVEAQAPVRFRVDDETDKTVAVHDDMVDLDAPGLLGIARWNSDGRATAFGYGLSLEVDPGTCGVLTNTASLATQGGGDWRAGKHRQPTADAEVELCSEAPLVVEKDAEAGFDRQYLWDIDKTAEEDEIETVEGAGATAKYKVTATPGDYEDSGWTLAGSVTVENPNDYKDVVVTVLDEVDVGGGAECTVEGGREATIGAGDSETFGYECDFDEEPEYGGTNTATAEWEAYDGATARAEGTADVEFELDEETDRTVTVLDDLAEPASDPEILGIAEWNEDGEPSTFDYSLELDGTAGTCVDYTNEASLEETDQSASADVEVCIESDPTAEHDAWAGMDRTYLWDIDKTAGNEAVMMGAGKKPATYTVAVTPDGFEDSARTLGGTVSVHNPNDYKSMSIAVDLENTLGGDATCALDAEDAKEILVGPGELLALPFGCDFGAEPDTAGTSTATLAWEDADGEARSVDAEADVVFRLDEEHNATVTVTDDQANPDGEARVLGTADWNAEGEPKVFGYTLDLTAQPGSCREYTNTATLVETGASDSATVRVCGIAAPLQPLAPDTTSGEPLPNTGANIQAILWVALALLLSGILALGAGRRRRHEA